MPEWLLDAKGYTVLVYYLLLFLSTYGYGVSIGEQSPRGILTGLGLAARLPVLRWMPALASLCGLYILIYGLLFVLHPPIQHAYLAIRAMQNLRVTVLGMLLVWLGLGVVFASQYLLIRAYRADVLAAEIPLVTSGLYGISRNPLYLGLCISHIGIFLMLPNWIYLACLMFFMLNYHYKITLRDEPELQQRYGDVYNEYRQRVNRYL